MQQRPVSSPRDDDDGVKIPEFCHLNISIAGEVQTEPIVIKLRPEECPKTCRNFIALCSSNERTSRRKPHPSYRGCEFHRIIDGFMVQGGDFEKFDGTGGYSPLFGRTFDDENLLASHDCAGVVSMANCGRNRNGSQFFITLRSTQHLDGKHVVFGNVIHGMESVRAMLNAEREGDKPVPLQRIVVQDCSIGRGDESDVGDDNIEHLSLEVNGDRDQGERQRRKKREKKKSAKKRERKKSAKKRRNTSSSLSSSSSSSSNKRHYERERKSRNHVTNQDTDDRLSEKRQKKARRKREKTHKK